jgi:hypothetical protein
LALAEQIAVALRHEISRRWPNGPVIRLWFDSSLKAGEGWDPQIETEIELADIILFLITPACLDATYMWNDEFPLALDRFRNGEGRVRLVSILYSDTLAPIRTHRHTRGLQYIPDKPHDQMSDIWTSVVVKSIISMIEAVLRQDEPPTIRLTTAVRAALEALETAREAFAAATSTGFFGPLLASDINSVLGGVELSLNLPGRERIRALTVWDPKLRAAIVRLRLPLPNHSEILRALRDALDEVVTFASLEADMVVSAHQPAIVPSTSETHEVSARVREEVQAVRAAFSDLSEANPAPTRRENEVREYTVDVGDRHAALAELILDEARIDAAALSDEVHGVTSAVSHFAVALEQLGRNASIEGKRISEKLADNAQRAAKLTEHLAGTADGSREALDDTPDSIQPSPKKTIAIFGSHRDREILRRLASNLRRMGNFTSVYSSPFLSSSIHDEGAIVVVSDALCEEYGSDFDRLQKAVQLPAASALAVLPAASVAANDWLGRVPHTYLRSGRLPDVRSTARVLNRMLWAKSNYNIYTTAHDEVVTAADIVRAGDREGLLEHLDKAEASSVDLIAPISERLSDARRLNENQTAITVLVDNSGSMRGYAITRTALCVRALSRLLNRCNIPHEVLGFTTRTWKGGKSREDWLADKKPKLPGRLNDIRYIVYKSFEDDLDGSIENFSAMVDETILRENIDGEALIWAADRLTRRPEISKLLLVISDGAPVDDSTLAVNPSKFLDQHLRETILDIEENGQIHLMATGIDHDVASYYRNSVKTSSDNLGKAIAELLFDES